MKKSKQIQLLASSLLALAVSLLAGCGDGSGVNLAEGGIRGTGASVGPVSGFGSVFVNGTRFEFDGNVASDDGIDWEDDLDLGMILRIEGQWQDDGQGTADTVEYDDTLRGPMEVVQAWDLASKTALVSVLDQTVLIDSQTVLRGMTVESLAPAFVRVSGWPLPNGDFRASYIGVLDAGQADTLNVELEGEISSLIEQVQQTFTLGGLEIRFSASTLFEGLSLPDLAQGGSVEVEGTLETTGLGVSFINALSIQPNDQRRYLRGDDEDEDIEFAGPVTSAYTAGSQSFTVNGVMVYITGETELDDGLAVTDLAEGVLVQVEGRFREDGSVEAEEIELREGTAEVAGTVTNGSIDREAGTFEVGGVQVQVMATTVITDDDDDNRRLGLNDLDGPWSVEVSGIERSGTNGEVTLQALKVERNDNDGSGGEFELVGTLAGMDATTVTVLGVTMTAGADAFEDNGRSDLLARFNNNERPLLEIDYLSTGSGYGAEDIELDDEEDN